MWSHACVPILSCVGRFSVPSLSSRRVTTSAALGFSVLWGAVVGVAVTNHDPELIFFGAAGMALTVALTAVLHRQQTRLQNLAATDSLTGLTNHRGFHEA